MKKIITGATILTGAIAMANDGGATANTTKKETKVEKDSIYRVIPKGSKVSVKGKKIVISNGNSMCSADKALTKATEVKKDVVKKEVRKSEPKSKLFTKKKSEDKEETKKEAAPKVKKRIIYIKEEISKKPTDKKEAKSNDDVDIDAIIKGIADRIAKES